MATVKFIKHNTPYSAGDIAKFEDDIANKFVKSGIAKHVEEAVDESTEDAKKNTPKK